MRVSERQRYDISNTRIEEAKSKNARMLEILSTQKNFNNISDNPTGTTYALRFRDKISSIKQYQKNLEFSKGFLERVETAITSIQDNLIRSKELAISLANDTYAQDSRESTSREVNEIIKSVVQMGNTTYNNRFVFSGFRTLSPALSEDGRFLGDDGVIFIPVGEGSFKQVNFQARNLFEATPDERQQKHFDLVDSLQILLTGLKVNDKDMIRTAIDELDFQMEKTTSYLATTGALSKSIENLSNAFELNAELAKTNLSNVEDADIYKATSDFKRTETVLQSTLLASNKLLQPSLFNFLQ